MRKVLFRIVFEQIWRCESVGNELLVGYGWIVAATLLIAIVVMFLNRSRFTDKAEFWSTLSFWLSIPAALILIPVVGLPFAVTGIPLFGYGFMIFVGFSLATLMAAWRARTVGLETEIIWDLMMWLLIPGLAGARILYLTQNWDKVMAGKQGTERLVSMIALWDGGIVFYGCVFGGLIGFYIFCRRRHIRVTQLADVIMPSLFIGLGFGRIGCFLFGCCFGATCEPTMPFAVHFPEDSNTFPRLAARSLKTGDSLIRRNGQPTTLRKKSDPDFEDRVVGLMTEQRLQELRDDSETTAVFSTVGLHPAQLYSSALAFGLAGLLLWFFPRRWFEGSVFALGLVIYPINRFVLEIIRDDEPGRLQTGLTFSQLASIAIILVGIALLVIGCRRKTEPSAKP